MPTRIYIGLGSNQGDRRKNLERAFSLLEDHGIKVEKKSSIYETSPVGPRQRDFLNCVLLCRSPLPPPEILRGLKTIERKLGRRPGIRWGPRPLDLDILFYGGRRIRAKGLRVPHPSFQDRKFVLKPLAEIAPRLKPPGSRKTIAQILRKLTDPAQKVKLYRS